MPIPSLMSIKRCVGFAIYSLLLSRLKLNFMVETNQVHRDLFALKRAYAALRPPAQIKFPSYLRFSTIHEFLLRSILLDPHLQRHPPSRQYQTVFWKWAIARLESFDELKQNEARFVVDILVDQVAMIVVSDPHTGPHPPSQSFLTHYWRTNHGEVGRCEAKSDGIDTSQYRLVTVMESRTTIERGTTGLRTWLASFVLAHYLTLNPDLVIGKCVLELGSGTGFLGIVIAAIQGSSPGTLWLTDVKESVLNRCHENVQLQCNLSSSKTNIQYVPLDWFDAIDSSRRTRVEELFENSIQPDIILGADLVRDTVNARQSYLSIRTGNKLRVEELECDWHSAPSFEIWEDGTDVNKGVRIHKIYGTKYLQIKRRNCRYKCK
ncbi:Protein-lysine N-methyltransferase EFM [Salix suchowensis]|nr:Protein-lysine N-methyltransferase EFM [Salix suchowensis]